MTLNYIVLLIAWTVLLIVTVLQQRTIKYQTKANDYLLDDIATLENKNDSLNLELMYKESDLDEAKEELESRETELDSMASSYIHLHKRTEELETLLKRLDPNKLTVDFDDGLKPYASTVKEVVDKYVKRLRFIG